MLDKEGAVLLGGSLPVPSVQELAKKEQLKAVPSRYVRPDQDPIIFDSKTAPQIPVIDLERLVAGDLENTNNFDSACREWGFFQVRFFLNFLSYLSGRIERGTVGYVPH